MYPSMTRMGLMRPLIVDIMPNWVLLIIKYTQNVPIRNFCKLKQLPIYRRIYGVAPKSKTSLSGDCIHGTQEHMTKKAVQKNQIEYDPMKLNKKIFILILAVILIGCGSPTEKFDGDYRLDIDSTLEINPNLTPKHIDEDLKNFSVHRGVIRCGKDRIREWKIYGQNSDGKKLRAHATMYIDREIIIERAIMHEDVDDIANNNKFEEEISLEFMKEKLVFCNWPPGYEASKFCSSFFKVDPRTWRYIASNTFHSYQRKKTY